jgi:hypothetical protein
MFTYSRKYKPLILFVTGHLQFAGVHLSVLIPSASNDAISLIKVSTLV